MSKILTTHYTDEILFHDIWTVRAISKRHSFFPWQLGGKPANEATRISIVFSYFSLCLLLLTESYTEEQVHAPMSFIHKPRIHPMVYNHKNSLFLHALSTISAALDTAWWWSAPEKTNPKSMVGTTSCGASRHGLSWCGHMNWDGISDSDPRIDASKAEGWCWFFVP